MVDEENIEETTTTQEPEPEPDLDTDVIIEDETIRTIETPIYTFTITQRLLGEYGVLGSILEWLTDNMESLVDDYSKPIFGKVNTGFNENILKTFGKKPVCDVYIKNIEYTGDFDSHVPVKIHSIVIFYLKGANNNTYVKACELHDLLVQEFITREDFKRCSVVRDTVIETSNVSIQTIRGGMGVMGAFELTHTLY